jgi:hypothetical protein
MMAAHEEIGEDVQLPDPEVQRLVHPLDLPEARGLFRTGWLIGALTSLPVSALIAAIIAYTTRSAVPPIIAFLALAVLGALAARWHTDRAWDYIPRKRQDRAGPLLPQIRTQAQQVAAVMASRIGHLAHIMTS